MTAFLSIADKRHIEEAAADPVVRSHLLADPRGSIERILGRPLGDVGIRLHEEPAGAMYFALPVPGQAGAVPEARTRRQFFENILFDVAERHPDLSRQARTDPRRMFFDLTGNDVDLPPGYQPVIFTDGPSEIHVVLPQPSESIEDELPDDLLEFVAGGAPSPCNSRAGANSATMQATEDKYR
ncbi:hypothetical protein JHL17_10130 [Azospirillum sp. YIM B02556]|uniref:Uncharacterized protein n=1 Tax=Azospirillum endophyticum TaxID=2800326 RepID=A0ABS1F2Y0_9PROT|nr:hypothetical protein [Azospirillum endophyticum]MBK1837772.1 hypothetical protein [Azospirillum endophyticum]